MKMLTKPKGNIMLLAVFVLLASGIIGVLISLMMKDFLRYHNALLNYNKASSLAKGAGELALAMIYQKAGGFEFETSQRNKPQNNKEKNEKADQHSSFLTKNFNCPFSIDTEKNETCPVNYGFDLKIQGTETLNGKEISIPAGLSHIITAFTLQIPSIQAGLLENGTIKETENIEISNIQDKEKINLSRANNNGFSHTKMQEKNYYFIISNTNSPNPKKDKEGGLSITINGDTVSSEKIQITTKGEYQDTIVEKQLTATNDIPDFLKGDNYLGGQ